MACRKVVKRIVAHAPNTESGRKCDKGIVFQKDTFDNFYRILASHFPHELGTRQSSAACKIIYTY